MQDDFSYRIERKDDFAGVICLFYRINCLKQLKKLLFLLLFDELEKGRLGRGVLDVLRLHRGPLVNVRHAQQPIKQ